MARSPGEGISKQSREVTKPLDAQSERTALADAFFKRTKAGVPSSVYYETLQALDAYEAAKGTPEANERMREYEALKSGFLGVQAPSKDVIVQEDKSQSEKQPATSRKKQLQPRTVSTEDQLMDALVASQAAEKDLYDMRGYERLDALQTEAHRENYARTLEAEYAASDRLEENVRTKLPEALGKLAESAQARKQREEWQRLAAYYREKAGSTYSWDERMAAIRNAESFERLIAQDEQRRKPPTPEPTVIESSPAVEEKQEKVEIEQQEELPEPDIIKDESVAMESEPVRESKTEPKVTPERESDHEVLQETPVEDLTKKETKTKLESLVNQYGQGVGNSILTGGNIPLGTSKPKFSIPNNLEGNFKYEGKGGYEFSIPVPKVEATKTPEEGATEASPKTAAEALDRAKNRAGKIEATKVFESGLEKQRANVKEKEMYYFSMLRRHQHERGFWDATLMRLGARKSNRDRLPLHLQELRQGVMKARAEEAQYLLGSIEARREGRGAKRDMDKVIEQGPNKGKTHGEVLRERYKRMFVTKEVVFGFENAEQKARMDGLRSRDRTLVERGWKWYNNLPPKQKILMSAPFIATFGTAALMGGAVPAALVTGLGIGAARLRWVAENRREQAAVHRNLARDAREAKMHSLANGQDALAAGHERVAGRYSGVAKWLTPAGWGLMIGGGLTRFMHRDKMAKAGEGLATMEAGPNGGRNYRTGDVTNPEALGSMTAERSDAAAKVGKYENRTDTARALSALAGGAIGGAAIGGAFHHVGPHPVPGEHAGTVGTGGQGGGVEGTPSAADPVAAAHHGFTAEINHRGEGADLLYKDLRGQLEQAYAGHTPPPVVAKLLSYKSLDQLSHDTGFENFPNSAVMHMHDKFVISPDGHSLSFVDAKGTEHMLMQETPQHEVTTISQPEGWLPMKDYTHHPAVAHETTPTRGDAAGDAQVANLNAAEAASHSSPTESVPAGSAPAPEQTPQAIPAGVDAHIDRMLASPAWNMNHGSGAWAAATTPINDPVGAIFRGDLLDVIRDAGIAPHKGEAIDQFLSRAADTIRQHPSGEHPGVYQSQDTLIARGGEYDARLLIAQEYVRTNPGAHVLVATEDGNAIMLPGSLNVDVAQYATTKLPEVPVNAKLIF
ncbi:MAG: hypothetical protein ACM3TU_02915 [Bacillota bacterium]